MQSDFSSLPDGLPETRFVSDGTVSGSLIHNVAEAAKTLLVCIHGGGCNGNYFDLKGCSTVSHAIARGYAVLLVTRPGYGANSLPDSDAPIAATAPLMRQFIDDVRAEHLPGCDGIVIVGHSIGGALTLTMASEAGDWPLLGIAVSGIGDRPCPDILNLRLPPGHTRIDPPSGLTDALFFAGGEPLSWRAVASLRAAAEPWLVAEVNEIMHRWPVAWPEIAARIRVPVHLRLAEHERVWSTGRDVIERMAYSLSGSARLNAAIIGGGGHLFEVSKSGPALVRSQLDFFHGCRLPRC